MDKEVIMDRKEYWREYKRKKRAVGKELTLEIAKEIEVSTPTVDSGLQLHCP